MMGVRAEGPFGQNK
jgi:hypothetical protein